MSDSIIVGMSGGVDSSVAAWLLHRQGYRVSGIFMQNWEDSDDQCTARQDYRDARAVCDRIGIELSTVNFAEEYWQRVFSHFLEEYAAGRTPNPDILCNQEIKFKAFLDHASRLGCDAIATGHYARTSEAIDGQPVRLLRGLDNNKDQSYFLYTLGQAQLTRARFPIGALEKQQVRKIAREAGFHLHAKKDSTGICFIGERKFRSFLSEYLPASPGEIISDCGRSLGTHQGLMYYTLGQRQGLGIGGVKQAQEAPWYVVEKRVGDNTLVVGQGHDHPALFRHRLRAHDLSWCADQPPAVSFRCTARVRYRQQDEAATVTLAEDQQTLDIEFDDPTWAATPGQSLVLYQQDTCLGGGIISDFD